MNLLPAFATDLGAVYNADCFTLFSALKDECVDAVFADPPFNLGKDYGRGADKDDLQRVDYLAWCCRWIDESVRVLKPGGSIFVYNLPQWAFHLAAHLELRGLLFRHWIAVSMKSTFPRGRKLYPAHYALLYFTKGDPSTFNRVRLPVPTCRHCGGDVKDYGGHRKYLNPAGLNLTDFWEDTSPARHQKFKARWHVNELKPLIPGRCIEMSTQQGDIVLDPFGGGGSTFEAAQSLARHWIGTEIVDCELIRERFKRNLPEVQPSLPNRLAALFKVPNPQLRIDPSVWQELSTKSTMMAPENVSNGSVLPRC
jgi:site-specific DNA-methyltransferase (adenine-specific)